MPRANISRILLILAALPMVAGGTGHTVAFRKATAVLDASNLSSQYAAIFKGLWLSIGVVITLIGLAYLMLALWPKLATKTTLGILGALPFASAISIYLTVGNFGPAHLLIACATMALLAALLHPGGTEPHATPEPQMPLA